jgi:hypothetical protein
MKNEFDICENVHDNKVIYKGLFILSFVLGTHSFSLLTYSLSSHIFSFKLFIKLKSEDSKLTMNNPK